MLKAIADTHAIIWYLENDVRLSEVARQMIDEAAQTGNIIGISTITLVEITYLIEKGKIVPGTLVSLQLVLDLPNAVFQEYPCNHDVAIALATVPRTQVPDMPDRIIATTALHLGVPLISRDGKVQLSHVPTIW